MPIKIPNQLPATKTLAEENIFVMTDARAVAQDIRPLQILMLNLMPTKIDTETQLSRLLGNTPLQVELTLMHTSSHKSKNTSEDHLLAFYTTFDKVKDRYFDGLVITGAPVEMLEFEEVEYWNELCEIMEWSTTHVHSTFHICWGAQAGLYYHFGVQKKALDKKMFGVFPHVADYKRSMLFRGFDDVFMVPHSRHTTIDRADLEGIPGLKILASSPEAGVFALSTKKGRPKLSVANIGEMSTRASLSKFPKIIIPITILPRLPFPRGALRQTSCIAIGSTTSFTRPRPSICKRSRSHTPQLKNQYNINHNLYNKTPLANKREAFCYRFRFY